MVYLRDRVHEAMLDCLKCRGLLLLGNDIAGYSASFILFLCLEKSAPFLCGDLFPSTSLKQGCQTYGPWRGVIWPVRLFVDQMIHFQIQPRGYWSNCVSVAQEPRGWHCLHSPSLSLLHGFTVNSFLSPLAPLLGSPLIIAAWVCPCSCIMVSTYQGGTVMRVSLIVNTQWKELAFLLCVYKDLGAFKGKLHLSEGQSVVLPNMDIRYQNALSAENQPCSSVGDPLGFSHGRNRGVGGKR